MAHDPDVVAVVQQRAFDYDGRGFLRWESHPEAGNTSYTYDSSGNVKTRDQGGAQSLFDLKYTYDEAGRLMLIEGRDPHNPLQFRIMKAFGYGEGTGAATATMPQDLRNGKLVAAARMNYGLSPNDPVYRIDHQYEYRDVAGRTSGRTTTISRHEGQYGVELKEVMIGMTYDALDLPDTISYPMCLDCGAPPVDPKREQIERTYDHGRLIALGRPATQSIPAQTFLSSATSWPNGMRHQWVHGNGITDTQLVGTMARVSHLSFGRYDRCVAPTFDAQPVSAAGGAPVALSVAVSGTGPFSYEWWNATDGTSEGNTPTVTVDPDETTEYYVIVTGACGIATSHTAKISVACVPPSNTIKGYGELLTVGPLYAPATYSLTITDACGSTTTNVTVQMPLSMSAESTVALGAWMVSSTRIDVAWPAVSGATHYVLERRSGPAWTVLAQNLTATSYIDASVVPGRTYAYRVYAVGSGTESGYSPSDVATTMTFTPAVSNSFISATPSNAMLAAVNAVRAAAGWSALTWANVLSPNDPAPAPGASLLARHVMSCRARMNEALQALGVPVGPYTTPDLSGASIAASHVNDVQARAQ